MYTSDSQFSMTMRIYLNKKILKIIVIALSVLVIFKIIHYAKTLKRQYSQINLLARQIIQRMDANKELVNSKEYHNLELFKPQYGKFQQNVKVTLATQCSSNHISDILLVNERWRGPISLTVFSHRLDISITALRIAYYWSCFPQLSDNITLYIVFPYGTSFEHSMYEFVTSSDLDCSSGSEMFGILKEKNYNFNVPYPHNVLRNVAINAADSQFVFVTDIDMVPSENAAEQFSNFIRRALHYNQEQNINRTAYVVPCFEVAPGEVIPRSKEELLKMMENFKIQPFYKEVCWKCQKYTDYNAWIGLPRVLSLKEGYEVEWKDPWEPFYIASKGLPLYDERFKQYGFNRISQVCEMHIAGYRFAVLNNIFLVHRGFKRIDKFHEAKDKEQQQNRLLFRKFKEELAKKYPLSDLRCY